MQINYTVKKLLFIPCTQLIPESMLLLYCILDDSLSVSEIKRKPQLNSLFGSKYNNNLFKHPYTKIEFVEEDMMVSRKTASKYLDAIVDAGLLSKKKIGKDNYYINDALFGLFLNHGHE